MRDLWDAAQVCEARLAAWRAAPWSGVKTDALEDGAKGLLRDVKALSKKARAAPAYQPLEACARNFLASVPLLADLRSPAMRPRHWDALIAATGAALDVASPDLQLGQLLALELHRYEDEVGEVVDRAQKEEKMEAGLAKLEDAWGRAEFVFAPHAEGSDVKLVKMADEDFEVRLCV
jgi:dynein heavy chain